VPLLANVAAWSAIPARGAYETCIGPCTCVQRIAHCARGAWISRRSSFLPLRTPGRCSCPRCTRRPLRRYRESPGTCGDTRVDRGGGMRYCSRTHTRRLWRRSSSTRSPPRRARGRDRHTTVEAPRLRRRSAKRPTSSTLTRADRDDRGDSVWVRPRWEDARAGCSLVDGRCSRSRSSRCYPDSRRSAAQSASRGCLVRQTNLRAPTRSRMDGAQGIDAHGKPNRFACNR